MDMSVLDAPGRSSLQGDRSVSESETASEIGNGINALLALSEQVRNSALLGPSFLGRPYEMPSHHTWEHRRTYELRSLLFCPGLVFVIRCRIKLSKTGGSGATGFLFLILLLSALRSAGGATALNYVVPLRVRLLTLEYILGRDYSTA